MGLKVLVGGLKGREVNLIELGTGLDIDFTANPPILSASGGGGGGTPGNPVNSIQLNVAGVFAGDANLTYAANQLRVGPTGTMFVGPDESSLPADVQTWVSAPGTAQIIHNADGDSSYAFNVVTSWDTSGSVGGIGGFIQSIVTGAGTSSGQVFGLEALGVAASGFTGHITDDFGFVTSVQADGTTGLVDNGGGLLIQGGYTNGTVFTSASGIRINNQGGLSTDNAALRVDAQIGSGGDSIYGIKTGDVSGGTKNAAIETGLGDLIFGTKSAAPDASLAASQFSLWLDDTDGAGKLMIKAKTANGTVRTAAISLS